MFEGALWKPPEAIPGWHSNARNEVNGGKGQGGQWILKERE